MSRKESGNTSKVNKFNRLTAAFLMLTLCALSICGCTAKKDENAQALNDAVNNAKDYIYSNSPIELPYEFEHTIDIKLATNYEDTLAFYQSKSDIELNPNPEDFGDNFDALISADEAAEEAVNEETTTTDEAAGEETTATDEAAGEEPATTEVATDVTVSEEPATIGNPADVTDKYRIISNGDTSDYELAPADPRSVVAFLVDENGKAQELYSAKNDYFTQDIKLGYDGCIYTVQTPQQYAYGDSKIYFVKYSREGEPIFLVPIDNVCENSQLQISEYLNFNFLVVTQDEALVGTTAGVIRFGLDGEVKAVIAKDKIDKKIEYVNGIAYTQNGKLFTISNYASAGSDKAETYVSEIDPKTFKIISSKTTTSEFYGSIFAAKGDEGYISTTSDIQRYNFDTNKQEKVMDFVGSNIDTDSPFTAIVANSEDSFLGVYSTMNLKTFETEYQLFLFKHIPRSEVRDRTMISLGMLNSNQSYVIKKQVFAFNRSSTDYQINLIDYSQLYKGTEEEIIKQINKDASAGNLPDILLVSSQFPVDVYIGKNLLVDLKEYMNNDPEFDSDNLLDNVVSAYTVEDKVYQLVPMFQLDTVVIKSSLAEGKTSWDADELAEFWNKMGKDKDLTADSGRTEFAQKLLSCTGDSFINWDNGTCNFETEEFYRVLRLLKDIPENRPDGSKYESTYWGIYANEEALIKPVSLYSMDAYTFDIRGSFPDGATFIGYPSNDGNGSVIKPVLSFAISNYSKCKEGAWEFVKGFFTDEFMDNNCVDYSFGFPNSKRAIDESITKLLNTKNDFELGGVTPKPITKEETDVYKDFILSVNKPYRDDSAVVQIFNEETAPYFSGLKTEEQVAEVIQGRISLLLAESR